MVEWFVKAVPEKPASRRNLIIAASAGVAVVALIGSFWSNGMSGSGDVVVAATAPAELEPTTPGTLFVHVVGEVANPGVYEVPVDSRVMDAVSLAGGLTDNADPMSLNLARMVQDGEQIIVGTTGHAGASHSLRSSLININTATQSDFETLPRIGPALADRIVAFRDEQGPFASVEGLLDVPGIGELTLAGMRDKITL